MNGNEKVSDDLNEIVKQLTKIQKKLSTMRVTYMDKRSGANQHIGCAHIHHIRHTINELNGAIKILTPK